MRVVFGGIPIVMDDGKREYISVWLNNKMLYTEGIWRRDGDKIIKQVYDEFKMKSGDTITVIGRKGGDFLKAKLTCCSRRGITIWIGDAMVSIMGVKLVYFYTTNERIAGYKVVEAQRDGGMLSFEGGGER